MADTPEKQAEVKETDIVFDCPHCGKSLAIDYRGAGLIIPCSDCGKDVEVPIPEGMELTDIDSSGEEREILILNLRRSLAAAEYRIGQLEAKIKEFTSHHEAAEKVRARDEARFRTIHEKVEPAQTALDEVSKGLKAIGEASRGA
jgi:hypothetical protein